MGAILRGICAACGYQANVLVGGGLRDCEPETALEAASGDRGLTAALSAGGQFQIQRFPATCTHCHELTTATQVTYWTPDGEKHVTGAICPGCDGPVRREDSPPCPICGGTLELRSVGQWD